MLSRRLDFNNEQSKALLHEQELDDIVYGLNFTTRADLNALDLAAFGVATISPLGIGASAKLVDHGMKYRSIFRVWNYDASANFYIPLPNLDYNVYVDRDSLYVQRVGGQSFLPTFYYFIFSNPGTVESSN